MRFHLPSYDEWYKAGYYQPAAAGGDSDGYWLYPMKTNSVPYSDQPPGSTPDNTRVANFFYNDGIGNGYNDGYAVSASTNQFQHPQEFLTPVGAYTQSVTYYGTFDQGGNVSEWSETAVNSFDRYLMGGSWLSTDPSYLRGGSDFNIPEAPNDYIGFRVVALPVPEPTVAGMLGLGAGLLVVRRWRETGRIGAK